MDSKWRKIFVFLKEFVWSQFDIKDYIKKHRIVLFSVFVNIVLFGLFIFFAEQAIVRTTMYRTQKEEIIVLKNNIIALELKEEELKVRIKYLNNRNYHQGEAVASTDEFLGEYDAWLERSAETVRTRNATVEEKAREQQQRRPTTDSRP